MQCPVYINREHCTTRFSKGRGNFPKPGGIVLVALRKPIEEYLKVTSTLSYPKNTDLGFPMAVNYAIAFSGTTYEIVEPDNTAWTFPNVVGSTWPLLTGDPNQQLITIGIETPLNESGNKQLKQLLCCLCVEYSIPPDAMHIVLENAIKSNWDILIEWPPDREIIGYVNACVSAGGVNPGLASWSTILPRVEALEEAYENLVTCDTELACSIDAQALKIIELQQQINLLQTSLTSNVQALQYQINTLLQTIQSMTSQINQMKVCIDVVCPTAPIGYYIDYELTPANEQTITPNVPVWLNLPVMIADNTPLVVTPGPLWNAELTVPCTYSISANALLAISDYCKDSVVYLDLIACGQPIRLATWIAPSDGTFIATLSGTTMLNTPPLCNDVHLVLGTNDITTPNKVVTHAQITIQCV